MSKVMAEECFEEQEMGSLPPVRLPIKVPESAWMPANVPKPMPRRFALASATTVDQDVFFKDLAGGPHTVSVHMPGMTEARTLAIPSARSRSNPRRSNFGAGRSGGRHPMGGGQRGPNNKPREPSGSYPSEQAVSASPSHSSTHRGRAGGHRGRSDNWTRQPPPAPLQT